MSLSWSVLWLWENGSPPRVWSISPFFMAIYIHDIFPTSHWYNFPSTAKFCLTTVLTWVWTSKFARASHRERKKYTLWSRTPPLTPLHNTSARPRGSHARVPSDPYAAIAASPHFAKAFICPTFSSRGSIERHTNRQVRSDDTDVRRLFDHPLPPTPLDNVITWIMRILSLQM
jgi:hypothetical protein